MIGVIDYGASNLRSVANTLKHLGVEITIATAPEQLDAVEKIILPGVGAFAPGMEQLHKHGFVEYVCKAAAQGRAILGICLGMQFLLDESEEDGLCGGLGLIPGRCVRFMTDLKVPHMGWNQLMHPEKHPFMSGVASGSSYAYFVHSYHAADVPDEYIIATTDYDYAYPSIIGKDNVLGVQFHPEKSQAVGQQLLLNFCEGRF